MQQESKGTFFGAAFAGAANDTSWGLSSRAFGEYVCDNWQSQLGFAVGTGVSMVAGLAYGGTEVKIASKALGFLGRNLGRIGRLVGFSGRRVKQIAKAEETVESVAKIARSERISSKAGYELNQFDRAASQLSQAGKDNIRTLRGWAKSKGWKRYSEAGKPEKWGMYRSEYGDYVWHLRIKPEASMRGGLSQGSNIPRFDSRIIMDPKKGSTYINPYRGTIGGKDVGTHLPLEKVYY